MNKKLEEIAKKDSILSNFLIIKKANELTIRDYVKSKDDFARGFALGLKVTNGNINRNIRFAYKIFRGA